MIAIPLKLNRENSPIAPLFGKAKWFAFIDEDRNITIEKNEMDGGSKVVDWLLNRGVSVLIMQRMSFPPYQKIQENGKITILYVGKERILLNDALDRYESEDLVLVDDTNAKDIIKFKKR